MVENKNNTISGKSFDFYDANTNAHKFLNINSGGQAIGKYMPQTATKYYYLKDPTKKLVGKHLGSTRVTINSAGNVVSYDDYDPWGLTLSGRSGNIGDATDKFKFTGKERDKETGLDYFGARLYDSWSARWFGVDPLDDICPKYSPYVYCDNNPISFLDLYGLTRCLIKKDTEADLEKYSFRHKICHRKERTYYYDKHQDQKRLSIKHSETICCIHKIR